MTVNKTDLTYWNPETEKLLKTFEAWRNEVDEDHVLDTFDLALAFYAGQSLGREWFSHEIDASERFSHMHDRALAFASLARDAAFAKDSQ